MSTTATKPNRGRRQIIALALLFFGPVILAWVLVWSGWRPAGTVNNGELIQPPVRISSAGWTLREGGPVDPGFFSGYWTLVAAESGACAADCKAGVDALRRIRVALDKDADRVRIVLLQPEGAPEPELERRRGLTAAVAPAGEVQELLSAGDAGRADRLVTLVDYQGYRIMRYPAPLDASGLLDDLERLLRAANEDVEHRLRQSGNGGAPQ